MAQPHPPHRKPAARPLDPADLPDPLGDSRDVPMASADDLLSEMVGDDVERMMSGEFEPIVTGHKAVERLQHQIGKFLDEVRQREVTRPTPPATPAPVAPVSPATPAAPARPAKPAWPPSAVNRRIVPPAPLSRPASGQTPPPEPPPKVAPVANQHAWHDDDADDALPSLDDLVGPTREQLVGLHSGEFESPTAARGPAESRALLARVDPAAGEPTYLKPLDWLSRPVAGMSGKGRVAVSMLAVVSFLSGCAALGYVLVLRHGGV